MAPTPTLARRAPARALIAALSLALIALPAQARADAGEETAPQSSAQSSTAAQSAAQTTPSDSPSLAPTGAPEATTPSASELDRGTPASSVATEPPTMNAPDETGRGAWIRDSIGWWWRRTDGTYPASQWAAIGGSRYYFNATGYMATGWLRDGDDWFFLAPSGTLLGGWVNDGGAWYYLDPTSGVMHTGMTGVDGTWYYMDSSGAMRTGWVSLADGWHYFASSGAQMGGWVNDGGAWYYLDPTSGVMHTGMTGVDGTWYYMDSSGAMRTGWVSLADGWHYFASSGAQMGGWVNDGGAWYYLDPTSGVMHTGMTGVDGTWYYMDSSGAMRTGWQNLSDGWHYFASSGAQMVGWLRDGGEWYYLDPNTGIMRTQPLEVGGRRYEFDASGAWRGYEAPAGYLQPTDHITGLGDATNTLTWGMNGTKVRIAQVRLGLWHANKLASVDAPFVAAVKNFQQRAGLPVTGVVDKATWDAMDTGYPWTVDQYQATPLPLTATRNERVEAMIGYAWNQTGSSYTWGGAGPYDLGFDCSGLVLQSLYVVGLDPQPINVIKHAWPSYRTSQELYAYPYFQHVPLAQRQRGDLIFYTTSGTVTHVAIYLGDDLIVHTDWMGRPARMQHITAGYGWDRMTSDVVRPLP